jgi:hypothetical protein
MALCLRLLSTPSCWLQTIILNSHGLAAFLLLFLYALSSTTLTYLISFAFTNPGTHWLID